MQGRILDIAVGIRPERQSGWASIDYVRPVPDLPVLPKTLLSLELMSQERCTELNEIADLLRQDLGAVARVFHFAKDEQAQSEERLIRLEDCISSIGVRGCLKILADSVVLPSSLWTAICRIWEHSAEIAECCGRIAAEIGAPVSEEDAYLVGLFHELDEFVEVLAWESKLLLVNHPAYVAQRVAEQWGLPDAVLQYFSERQSTGLQLLWRAIVDKAHFCCTRRLTLG